MASRPDRHGRTGGPLRIGTSKSFASPTARLDRLEVSHLIVGKGFVAERLGYAYGEVTGSAGLRWLMGRWVRRLKVIALSDVADISQTPILANIEGDAPTPPRQPSMTDGLAVVSAWAIWFGLVGVLAWFVLRGGR